MRRFWMFFGAILWVTSLLLTSFCAQAALDVPPKNDFHIYVEGLMDRRALFWLWIMTSFIAYVAGPVLLIVIGWKFWAEYPARRTNLKTK